ncbi:Uncharacterized J domain-containing protein C1778.01c [Taphrina deformans PYCC 5710]|uniref:Uncharacterized J domain-containing protein C1778.01c n=1 Tax=Taphrina deformans (strain PYCC 5710 / ATCC 11124 / CBS 356.35 / IMI 108563 / JCM 9778 / NBRC 8474) TaxID=1097556 RepID=R4XB91_TAPDE|nr:Uncharacterized J domain-containing protein C1778.01c [Taphrina deformans PYCC 5710]|eukprot:CCG83088.1 Uncharacterized J domain-containing protein C1778.01c [Taphrina deformans PYCC 5710]
MSTATATLSTPPVSRQLEPVGQYFLAHARRKRHGRTFSEDERIQAEQNVKKVEVVEDEEEDEPESAELLKSDPKDWKKQDHYAVLGLSKYRYKANDAQIKKAHRKKVLKHHPDKKASGGNVNDDAFFKCIQKAMEILSDPVKRKQYDSVDEGAEVAPPSKKAKDFYKTWGRALAAEGRFSTKSPVPKLGGPDATKEEVDEFYNFFYAFDSWRTFEYLDKDLPDDTDNRDQKRYQEKKNRAERAKRKTEDTARLRKMVDDALSIDPRIKQFKENAKKAKEQAKWDREAGAREAAEKARLEKENAEKAAAEAASQEKANKESNKKAKEDAKKAARKDKKTLKASLKDANYFHAGSDAPMDVVDKVLTEIEALMEKLEAVELHEFAGTIAAAKGDATKIKEAFVAKGASL